MLVRRGLESDELYLRILLEELTRRGISRFDGYESVANRGVAHEERAKAVDTRVLLKGLK